MTRRLAIVIIGVALATLLLAGAGTLVLANVRARHTTERELRVQASKVSASIGDVLDLTLPVDTPAGAAQLRRRLRLLTSLRTLLSIDDLVVLRSTNGGALTGDTLPAGISVDDLQPAKLAELRVTSGNSGNTVYAAAPATIPRGGLLVIVLVRDANAGLGASVRLFLLASAATLALALGMSILLGKRLTRPVRDASAATQRIADGQLATRIADPGPNHHDELTELGRNINEMAATLERSRVLEQQFLLSVSHDLRTPLTSIRGYADAITDGAAEPTQAAGVIRSEARRLERLVADLLDLAKLQARAFSLQPARLDLTALAATAVAGFTPDAAERDVRMIMAPGSPVAVTADGDRLAQALANLLENALKFARSTVITTVSADSANAFVTVDDDGQGIAPADLPHVFERLYVARSQPLRKESSSGLGLAIVKEIVEASGGRVSAGVSPSGGARMTVQLPLASTAT